ncbi:MMPL family transporter [Mesonia maritima]|uniref:SSD domain-containing protein n=1 Tax=Mesonia maritima TaxID=1793873 RepID=A0ABU1KAP7_9FLAO|nr:MMPL family transporter [Mesonia maritima]MDR6301663.1 hypothetical protein [Mesonia maritima]
MSRFFIKLYHVIQQRKMASLVVFLLLIIVFGFSASKLHFKEDITALIPDNEQAEEMQEILKTVSFSDKIIVNISSEEKNKDSLVSVAEEFLTNLANDSLIKKIQGKVSSTQMNETYNFVQQNLPFFLNENDYKIIEQRLAKDSVENRLQGIYKSLLSPAGSFTKKYALNDPLQITSLGLNKFKQLRVGEEYELYQNFLFANNCKNLLLFLTPNFENTNAEKAELLVEKLTEISSNIAKKHTSVKISLFGSVFYSVANAKQIKADIQFTVGIAFFILLLILIFFYRKIYIPFVLFLPSLLGALTALAFIYFFQQEISLISLGIGAVLIGISIDYGLHVLTHYRNHQNIKKLYKEVSIAIIMSSLTTATAFICLLFLKSKALNDLGIFAAISVVFAAFFSLVIIPQLYKKSAVKKVASKTIFDRLASYPFERSKIIIGLLVAAFIFGLFVFQKVKFNEDLSTLNYEPEELAAAKNQLSDITFQDKKTLYVIAYGNSFNESLEANKTLANRLEKLKNKETILSYSGIGEVVLPENIQDKKIKRWNSFWNENHTQNLIEEINKTGKNLGLNAKAFSGFQELIGKNYAPISLEEFRKVETLSIDEFISTNKAQDFYTIISSVKLEEEKINDFKAEFKNDKALKIIDRQGFNQDLLSGLKEHFNSLLGYSFAAVFLILLLFYRNFKLSIITLFPIGITWIIALGMMYLLEIQFNIFNIIISTFIFGLGVDYSIFMTNGLRQQLKNKECALTTHKTSIILSVITTLLGMGALIFAKHPALHSIALISIIGILTAVLVSFALQPFIFKILMKKHA